MDSPLNSNANMSNIPLVSILLPVRNGEKWIQECLMSLHAQTFTNYEILLIDDGCTDNSIGIATEMGLNSIRIVDGPRKGLGAALALGVNSTQSPFIARQDVDDLSHPKRLQRQMAFLDAHPECVLLGTNAYKINEFGYRFGETKVPTEDRSIKLQLNLYNPFVHTSVIMRRSAVIEAGNYHSRQNSIFAEDYDLWSRMSSTGSFSNLKEALVSYRSNPIGISESSSRELRTSACAISISNLERTLGARVSKRDRILWSSYYGRSRRLKIREAVNLYNIILNLLWKFKVPPFTSGFRIHDLVAPCVWTLRKPRIPDQLPFDERDFRIKT